MALLRSCAGRLRPVTAHCERAALRADHSTGRGRHASALSELRSGHSGVRRRHPESSDMRRLAVMAMVMAGVFFAGPVVALGASDGPRYDVPTAFTRCPH